VGSLEDRNYIIPRRPCFVTYIAHRPEIATLKACTPHAECAGSMSGPPPAAHSRRRSAVHRRTAPPAPPVRPPLRLEPPPPRRFQGMTQPSRPNAEVIPKDRVDFPARVYLLGGVFPPSILDLCVVAAGILPHATDAQHAFSFTRGPPPAARICWRIPLTLRQAPSRGRRRSIVPLRRRGVHPEPELRHVAAGHGQIDSPTLPSRTCCSRRGRSPGPHSLATCATR
jgi:hypothetical protein